MPAARETHSLQLPTVLWTCTAQVIHVPPWGRRESWLKCGRKDEHIQTQILLEQEKKRGYPRLGM